MYSTTRQGVGKISPDSSRCKGAGTGSRAACRKCRSLNSSAAMCGLCARHAALCRRTIIFCVRPSGCSISSAVTCAEMPPFSSQARSSVARGAKR